MKFSGLFFRLQALEKRVFIENGDLPKSVSDIRSRVAEFKHKLQVYLYIICFFQTEQFMLLLKQNIYDKN